MVPLLFTVASPSRSIHMLQCIALGGVAPTHYFTMQPHSLPHSLEQMRRSLVLLLAGLAGVTAFQPICPLRPRSNAPKLPSTSCRSTTLWGTRMNNDRDGSEERGLQDALRLLARGVAGGMLLVSAVLGGGVMPAGAAPDYDAQTVKQQLERVDKVEQKELRDELTNPGNVIAKGIIRLPSSEELPLGPNTAAAYNLALENDEAALLLTAYGREGGPVAAKRVPLRGLEFPYNFELTIENLLFPQTKATWEKDSRAADDLGISVLLDLDGKFASANENDLLGFGISKPVNIAGSVIRRDALIVVAPRSGVKQYTDDELDILGNIDFELDRQAAGASLSQLAEAGGSIEVLTGPKKE